MSDRVGAVRSELLPRTTIKGQALADFIVEFTYSNVVEVTGTTHTAEDDASNDTGSRVSMMLISPKGHKIHCALRFGFKALNNEAEYEALIVGLHLALELQVCNMKIFSDS